MHLTPDKDFKVFMAMIGVLALPAAITLNTIEKARNFVEPVAGVSPLGYTISLLLFIIPALAVIAWLYMNNDEKYIRKSFWITMALLVPIGFILDIVFGLLMFTFVNSEATLQIYFPAFDLATMSWKRALPIEEFIFYISGFVTVLLMYIWCDEYWLSAYNVPDYHAELGKDERIVMFHPKSVIIGLILIVLAVVVHKIVSGPAQGGFPGYFTFIVVASFIPSAGLFKTTYRFINWRAVSLTFFFILLTSLLWEATMAVPYQWWGYNMQQMIGITIGAWTRLPVEETLVWGAVTFTTVIVYEAIKIWLNSQKTAKQVFLGLE